MNIQDCVSLNEACQISGAYDRLFLNLAKTNDVEVIRRGHIRYVRRVDAEKMRAVVQAWKNRPRVSYRAITA